MKYLRFLVIVLFITFTGNLTAQTLNGMSLNGTTGLYSIPTGRIGWGNNNLAVDMGYHTIISEGTATHIPKVSLSLFRWVELSAAFDIQPERHTTPDKNTDFIGGAKVQIPLPPLAFLALGGNIQTLNLFEDRDYRYNAGQIFASLTYGGRFFDWPAETTMVIGKTFIEDHSDSTIDFGMGFTLVLLPNIFGNNVHWISDFANFSYSVDAYGANAWARGVMNTGIRIDLGLIPVLRRFKFILDVSLVDILDHNRAFSMGAVFGIPLM